MLATLAACSPAGKGGQFSQALAASLPAAARAGEIDLTGVSAFVWDEVFILAPKSTRDDNCRALDLGWLDCRITFPATIADDEDFLVFRAKQKVIRAERHPRVNGDFAVAGDRNARIVARSAARFTVVAVPGAVADAAPQWRLEPIGATR